MTQPLVGKQILIVEDEPVFRSLLDSWFSSLGATTVLAADGVDALELRICSSSLSPFIRGIAISHII
ncbi:two-component system response regulator RssB, partial [Escherichia coli]